MKIKNSLHVLPLLTATIALVPQIASATPTIESRCAKEKKLKDPKNGTGVIFNQDCSVAYVLPPAKGVSTVGNVLESTNLNLCPAVHDALEISNQSLVIYGKLMDRIEEAMADLEARKVELQAKGEQIGQLKADIANLKKRETDLAKLLKEAKKEAIDATKEYRECKSAGDDELGGLDDDPIDPPDCSAERAKAVKLRKAYKALRAEFRELRDELLDKEYELDGIEQVYRAQTNLIDDDALRLSQLKTQADSIRSQTWSLYKEYSVLEGALANFYYELELNDLIAQYESKNEDFDGKFLPVPLHDMQFHVSAFISDSSSLPALLGVSVPGLGTLASPTNVPEGSDEAITLDALPPKHTSGSVNESVRGGHANGANVSLALTGTCGSWDPETKTLSKEALDASILAMLTYSYQVQAKRQFVATYNMSHWIDQLESLTKKRRFLKSETFKTLSSRAGSREWFKIDFSGNDAEFNYTAQEQSKISTDVANQLQQRAMEQLAVQNGVALPKMPRAELVKTGADIWSRKKCGGFFYCRVSNWVSSLLNSFWSNQSAHSRFKRSNQGWQTHQVRGTQMVRRNGTALFVPREAFDPSDAE